MININLIKNKIDDISNIYLKIFLWINSRNYSYEKDINAIRKDFLDSKLNLEQLYSSTINKALEKLKKVDISHEKIKDIDADSKIKLRLYFELLDYLYYDIQKKYSSSILF